MSKEIRSLASERSFPYREGIIRALAAGASCRKDDRILLAKNLIGTYQIRLRIAQDPRINGAINPEQNTVARDLATIVANLALDPEARIDVFYICDGGHKTYFLFENAHDGTYVGCMCADQKVV